MKITDEMRIAIERAMIDSGRETDAMIAAVAPLILEEAAKVAEIHGKGNPRTLAHLIRALTPPRAP